MKETRLIRSRYL